MRTDPTPTSTVVENRETLPESEASAKVAPAGTPTAEAAVPAGGDDNRVSLLPEDVSTQFRSRWETIQGEFVDDPRRAVEQAGALAVEALKHVSAVFDEKREQLQRGTEISTEELRQTLRRYRLLLNCLL
jgi:hypothetical protein